ncbi:MAG: phosphate transport system regulatory protein PhoU [Chloroflexi bacterium]|nr:MAG: phosphate transport system regulatory protein PhoU [Chloroflexota bacterium]
MLLLARGLLKADTHHGILCTLQHHNQPRRTLFPNRLLREGSSSAPHVRLIDRLYFAETVMNRQSFQIQLDALTQDTLALGYAVANALHQALKTLTTNDTDQMRAVIENDRNINATVAALRSRCLTMIARQQPMASDLREISVMLSLLPELERMADHAATICKIGQRILASPEAVPLQQMSGGIGPALTEMGSRTLVLLQHGLDAFARRDAAFAEQLCEEDHAIDRLYKELFAETIAISRTAPHQSSQVIHLLTLAHNIERIGDRVTNLAEQIIFLLRGEVVELNS